MANDVGDIKEIRGTSMNLNTQAGQGAVRPEASAGKENPGDTKPKMPKEEHVKIP